MITFLLILSLSSKAQENKILTEGDLLRVDKMGNAYLRVGNNLHQFNQQAELTYTHEAVNFGALDQFDPSNPLRIIIFYQDLMNVVTLDNTLSEASTINLLQLGYQQVTAVARARDNNIWVYDYISFQLHKIDGSGRILNQSEDLNVLLGEPIEGVFIVQSENEVFMSDPNYGILVFDAYGTYSRTIPVKGLTEFQIIQGRPVIWDGEALVRINKFLENEVIWEDETLSGVIEAATVNQHIYLRTNDELIIRSF